MNVWVEKSIKLAEGEGYLDKLAEVYNIEENIERDLNKKEIEIIKKEYNRKNVKKLINTLLNLERFPIDDPFISFIKKNRGSLDKNPETTKRISNRLFSMNIDALLKECKKPKSASRQM